MSIKNILEKWFKKPEPSGIQFKKIEFINSIADVPKKMDSTMFIVQNDKNRKWVVFECPDNCGNRVEVNLMKSKVPFWTLKIKRKKVTLYPSVIVKDCNSHFWIIDSKVVWSKFEEL